MKAKDKFQFGDLVIWETDTNFHCGIVVKTGFIIQEKVYHSYVDIVWHNDEDMRFYDLYEDSCFEEMKLIARA